MRIGTLIIIIVVLFSCNNSGKLKTKSQKQTSNEKEYPKLNQNLSSINYIFDYGYQFADDIFINNIGIVHKGGDKYQFIISVSDSNLSKIENLKISAVFYAKEPSLFKDKIYRDRKSRQVASKCVIYDLDGEKVLAFYFEMLPKDFPIVKFYFYDDNGVLNNEIISVRNIKLSE